MTPRSAKAKGRALQNYIADLICKIFDLSKADVKPAIMGEKGEDIRLSSKARQIVNLGIECKNQERVNVWEAYDQASKNSQGMNPVVFIKRNRSQVLAVVDATYLLNLIKAGKEDGRENN